MDECSRRRAIVVFLGAAVRSPALCREPSKEAATPFGWRQELAFGKKVYVRGPEGKSVVLLHELNGLSPGCIDFGVELAHSGFNVHMPLLFGAAGQNSVFWGTIESCVFGGFHCFSAGRKTETRPVRWLRQYVNCLVASENTSAIGVIGMCETGAYPLAAMDKGSKVKAVVLSQPALPLSANKQGDVGLTQAAMLRARESAIPILALRFKCDTISTKDRYLYLQQFFGAAQFSGRELDGPPHFEQTWTHRLHAVLTGPFGNIREGARQTVIDFLHSQLR